MGSCAPICARKHHVSTCLKNCGLYRGISIKFRSSEAFCVLAINLDSVLKCIFDETARCISQNVEAKQTKYAANPTLRAVCMPLTEQCLHVDHEILEVPCVAHSQDHPHFQSTQNCYCWSTAPLHKMQRIPRALAPSRPLLDELFNTQTRQCRRLLSSQSSQVARRPAAAQGLAPSQRYRPLVQKRFKYKTVEEAKSRYRSGVCSDIPNLSSSTFIFTRRLTVPSS